MNEFKLEIPQTAIDDLTEKYMKLVDAERALKKARRRARVFITVKAVTLVAVGASVYAIIKNQEEETE